MESFRQFIEDYDADQGKRRLAKRVLEKILKEIDSIPLKRHIEYLKSVARRTGFSVNPVPYEGFSFNLGTIMPEFDGLTIFLCNKHDNVDSVAFYQPLKQMIYLPVLDGRYEVGEGDEYTARLRLKSWYKSWGKDSNAHVFVHEFIHYLDHRRYKNPYDFVKNDEDYFNNPREFNAYYMELISKLDKLGPNDFKKSFKKFLKMLPKRDFMNKYGGPVTDSPYERGWVFGSRNPSPVTSWQDKLNDDYRQKFFKRLYQYYMAKRQQFGIQIPTDSRQ